MAKQINFAQHNINDEFYTEYDPICDFFSEVLLNHPDYFTDKNIICPCDSLNSNFPKYFTDNFDKLKWSTLTCIQYDGNKQLGKLFGGEAHGMIHKYVNGKFISTDQLSGSGDFRSSEVITNINMSDIIITNPPFSLFVDFMDICISSGKEFFVVGTQMKTTSPKIFSYFRNKIIAAYDFTDEYFITPNGTDYKICNACWWSNVRISKPKFTQRKYSDLTSDDSIASFYKNRYDVDIKKTGFPYIDGTDCICIDNCNWIPSDYIGKMAVPMTICIRNMDRFIIIDKLEHPTINGISVFKRTVIELR